MQRNNVTLAEEECHKLKSLVQQKGGKGDRTSYVQTQLKCIPLEIFEKALKKLTPKRWGWDF